MELSYIEEYTSCVSYKAEEYSGFSLGQALTGGGFDDQEQGIKANHLIFILSGEVGIIKDKNKKARVHANEFVFIPISFHYVGRVILPGRYINFTFFRNNISLRDKRMLSSYLKEKSDVSLYFEALPIEEPLSLFPGLPEAYLQIGVNCKYLHGIKEWELFIIFRTTYTKKEMIRLSHPIMGEKFDSKIVVLQHEDQVYSKEGLAQLLGMSSSDLQRKFIQGFEEPVSVWLQKQKDQKIPSRSSCDSISIKKAAREFGFLSASSFSKYCKYNFGYSPTELKKQIKERRIESSVLQCIK